MVFVEIPEFANGRSSGRLQWHPPMPHHHHPLDQPYAGDPGPRGGGGGIFPHARRLGHATNRPLTSGPTAGHNPAAGVACGVAAVTRQPHRGIVNRRDTAARVAIGGIRDA
jgi:hypothetical protein